MYKRINIYPNGMPIPESLPDSYQPAAYGNTPAGQSCLNCKHFNLTSSFCSAWKAPVKPRWWCDDWSPMTKLTRNNTSALLKKITTSTVEEHFSEVSNTKVMDFGFDDDYFYENEEDTIKLNVPLIIRLLEWAREEAWKDVELHVITERLIELSEKGDTLTMSDYSEIVRDIEVEKKET